jgi:hypothetical protein
VFLHDRLIVFNSRVLGASFNNLLDALDCTFRPFEDGDDPEGDGIYPDPLPGGFKGSSFTHYFQYLC